MIALLAAAGLLAACGGAPAKPAASAAPAATASAAASASKTMTVALWSAPDTFNPITAQTGYDDSVIGLMFDTLVWESPDQTFHPLLASSWQASPDGKTFTFHINPKANWTDGQPVTSADVQYTLDQDSNPQIPAQYGSLVSLLVGSTTQGKNVDPGKPLAGIRIINAKTFQLLTKGPTDINTLLSDIGVNIFIAPKHAVTGVAPQNFAKAPFYQHPTITDGPYEFVKYVNSQYVQLKPNPNYYLGAPKLDQLIVKVVPPTSMLAELRDGEIDATMVPGESDVPLQDWPAIKSLANVKQDPVPGFTTQYVLVNTARPYLKNPVVREALTMAINRQEIVTALLKGEGQIAVGPIDPLFKYADTSLKPYPYDPAKAKAMLKAAGFPFSQPLQLLVPTGNQIRQESAPLIQQNLQAIGLTVNLQQYDFATMLANATKGNYDLALVGSTFGADPSLSASWFSCGGSLNRTKFCNATVDKLYQEGLQTASFTKRKAIYDQLQQIIYKDAPMIFLYNANGLMAYNTSVDTAAIPDAYGMQQGWLWGVQ